MKYKLDCGCIINNKKQIKHCAKCNMTLCEKHQLYYIDGNNIAITKNSKPYCRKCSLKVYGIEYNVWSDYENKN